MSIHDAVPSEVGMCASPDLLLHAIHASGSTVHCLLARTRGFCVHRRWKPDLQVSVWSGSPLWPLSWLHRHMVPWRWTEQVLPVCCLLWRTWWTEPRARTIWVVLLEYRNIQNRWDYGIIIQHSHILSYGYTYIHGCMFVVEYRLVIGTWKWFRIQRRSCPQNA